MKDVFSVFPFKDIVLISFGKVLNELKIKSKYYSDYLPSILLVERFVKNGHVVSFYKKSLQVMGKGEYKDSKFLIRPSTSDDLTYRYVIERKEYTPLINLIESKNQLEDIKVIIDAGAYVGFTAIYFKKIFPQARLVCIEADRSNFYQLEENLKMNSLKEDVKALHKALWHNEEDELFLKDDFRDGEAWAKTVGLAPLNAGHYKVGSITLETILKSHDIEVVDILKINVEGAEVGLFNDDNFIRILSEKVRFVAIEIHDEFDCREMIESRLQSCNFDFFVEGDYNFCFNKRFLE